MAKREVWKRVASRDIKDEVMSLSSLKEWIKDNTPAGLTDDEVRLNFSVEEFATYYDDTIIEVQMELEILEK